VGKILPNRWVMVYFVEGGIERMRVRVPFSNLLSVESVIPIGDEIRGRFDAISIRPSHAGDKSTLFAFSVE